MEETQREKSNLKGVKENNKKNSKQFANRKMKVQKTRIIFYQVKNYEMKIQK